MEYAGKTEDPGMVNVTSDESICRRASRSPLLPIASNNARDMRILTILTRAGADLSAHESGRTAQDTAAGWA